jgi:hypothetical protein
VLRDRTVTRERRERRVGIIPQKNHSLRHLTGGFDIERRKYGLIPGLDRTEMSTEPHIATSASKPGHNRMQKKWFHRLKWGSTPV